MQYRAFGKTGLSVSEVSLGTEYLMDQPRDIVTSVVRAAIDAGVNYMDVFGAGAEFRDNMGAALKGIRDRVMLGAHLGSVMVNGQYDKTRDRKTARDFIDDWLRRYQTDYVDVLHLHNCDDQADYDLLMSTDGLLGLALDLQRQGYVRHLAFSGHTPSTSRQAVETGVISVLTYPVNLAGHAAPGRRELFDLCAERGVGIIAMKPYAGGKLLSESRTLELEHWHTGSGSTRKFDRHMSITPVQCLSYVLTQAGVVTAIPGCRELAHLEQALAYETATVKQRDFGWVLADYSEYVPGQCTYCNHCLPCPSGVDIGQVIRLLDEYDARPSPEIVARYRALPVLASECVQCYSCERRCPFSVGTVARLERAVSVFETAGSR
jgi:uncharacterized protein